MKKYMLIIICLVALIGLSGCNIHTNKDGTQERNYQENIDTIYFSRGPAFGPSDKDTAYKFDLKNGAFYTAKVNTDDSHELWGTTEGDADLAFVSDLDYDKIDNFFRQTARHGLTNWKESYRDNSVLDGSSWYIKIIFSDQTIMESYGINKYPSTWDKVMEDFEELTGENF